MLKELLLSLCSVSTLSTPVVSRNLIRSHTVQQDGMEITYKYETNEVNSANDLIIGNIYHIELNGDAPYDLSPSSDFDLYFLWVNGSISYYTLEEGYQDDNSTPIRPIYSGHFTSGIFNFISFEDSNMVYSFSELTCVLDIVILNGSDLSELDYHYFSESSYNEIESVERVYPDNIFGYVSEFIDEHLLNGIPNIDNVSYQIGGQTITLRSWLNTSICVVLAILLIWLLIWFVRYLFRLFSGLLH